jgi:hypothetical protein
VVGRKTGFLRSTSIFLLHARIVRTALSKYTILFSGRKVELFEMPFHGTYTLFSQEGKLGRDLSFQGWAPLLYPFHTTFLHNPANSSTYSLQS